MLLNNFNILLVVLIPALTYATDKTELDLIYQYNWSTVNRMGTCYEVDKETEGSLYKNEVDYTLCRGELETEFLWLDGDNYFSFYINGAKSGCYESDIETDGKQFFFRVDNTICKNAHNISTEYTYEWSTIENDGICYEVDKETKGSLYRDKLDDYSLCRGELETEFLWFDGDNYFSYYINGAKNDCYESDIETEGKQFFFRVDNELCK